MKLKNLFRSRSLGGEAETAEDLRQRSPEAVTPQPEEAAAPPSPEARPTALELSPEHDLYLLWSLYSQQTGRVPEPCLDLAEGLTPEQESPDGELSQELSRLEGFASRTARARVTELLREDGAPPPDLDAEVRVFLPVRRMTAWVLVYPPSGSGGGVSAGMVRDALQKAGVRFGVDDSMAERLPELPDRYFHLFLAARGQPPVHGRDGYVVDLFSRDPIQTLKEDDDGRVDFTSLGLFQNAKKGDIICHIVPPTLCRDGTTVLGQPVRAREGKPPVIPKGRNTELSGDGNDLIAVIEGHVEFGGRNFQVKPVLEINANVDFSTGNINSLGDIHIRGDVRSGFTVRTTGNITVDGVIEAGTVEAGGNLVVRKGVQGSGQAVLHAHRSIYARFLESASIYAHENLDAESIINCNVYSDGVVTARTGRGTVVGGSVHAAREINAYVVGSRSEQPTAVFLGGRPCEEFERDGLERDIRELEDGLEKTGRQPDSPAKLQQMSKMRMQIAADKMKLQRLDRELEKAREEEGDKPPCHGRLCCGTLHPGVEITIGKARMRVAHETKMCIATVSDGEVTLI